MGVVRAFWGCGVRRRVGLCGCVRFRGGSDGLLGESGRVWSVWDAWNLWERFLLVCLSGCGAGLAELGESADTGEGGEVEVGSRPSGGEAQDQFSSVVHDPLRAV